MDTPTIIKSSTNNNPKIILYLPLMLKRFTYLLLRLFVTQTSFSQNDYKFGNFSIKNFNGTNDYKSVAQNWDIIQNNENFIVVANNSGILLFDGVNWSKCEMSVQQPVRS